MRWLSKAVQRRWELSGSKELVEPQERQECTAWKREYWGESRHGGSVLFEGRMQWGLLSGEARLDWQAQWGLEEHRCRGCWLAIPCNVTYLNCSVQLKQTSCFHEHLLMNKRKANQGQTHTHILRSVGMSAFRHHSAARSLITPGMLRALQNPYSVNLHPAAQAAVAQRIQPLE